MEPFYTQHQHGPTTAIDFQTESLMNGQELERIAKSLYRLIDEEHRARLLLDFTKVRYLSSQAIGMLLALNKKLAQTPGASLALCGVGPQLMELLKITRLHRVFTIYPSQKEALGKTP